MLLFWTPPTPSLPAFFLLSQTTCIIVISTGKLFELYKICMLQTDESETIASSDFDEVSEVGEDGSQSPTQQQQPAGRLQRQRTRWRRVLRTALPLQVLSSYLLKTFEIARYCAPCNSVREHHLESHGTSSVPPNHRTLHEIFKDYFVYILCIKIIESFKSPTLHILSYKWYNTWIVYVDGHWYLQMELIDSKGHW